MKFSEIKYLASKLERKEECNAMMKPDARREENFDFVACNLDVVANQPENKRKQYP